MIDLVITYIFLGYLLLIILSLTVGKNIEKLIESENVQHILKTDFISFLIVNVKENWPIFLIVLLFVSYLYDNVTTCDNDPLGINKCTQVDPREYDSYRGRR